MIQPDKTGKIRAHIRNILSVTESRTKYMTVNNTVPSRPIDPIRVFQPVEYKGWWRSVLSKEGIEKANLTVTFSDGSFWDLREGVDRCVREYL